MPNLNDKFTDFSSSAFFVHKNARSKVQISIKDRVAIRKAKAISVKAPAGEVVPDNEPADEVYSAIPPEILKKILSYIDSNQNMDRQTMSSLLLVNKSFAYAALHTKYYKKFIYMLALNKKISSIKMSLGDLESQKESLEKIIYNCCDSNPHDLSLRTLLISVNLGVYFLLIIIGVIYLTNKRTPAFDWVLYISIMMTALFSIFSSMIYCRYREIKGIEPSASQAYDELDEFRYLRKQVKKMQLEDTPGLDIKLKDCKLDIYELFQIVNPTQSSSNGFTNTLKSLCSFSKGGKPAEELENVAHENSSLLAHKY